jgi:hypothetical protein
LKSAKIVLKRRKQPLVFQKQGNLGWLKAKDS